MRQQIDKKIFSPTCDADASESEAEVELEGRGTVTGLIWSQGNEFISDEQHRINSIPTPSIATIENPLSTPIRISEELENATHRPPMFSFKC